MSHKTVVLSIYGILWHHKIKEWALRRNAQMIQLVYDVSRNSSNNMKTAK